MVWKNIPSNLQDIVENSKTFKEILDKLRLANSGASYKTLKKRLKEANIDYSHIPEGIGANRGRCWWKPQPIQLSELFIKNSKYGKKCIKKYAIKMNLLKNMCAICSQGPLWHGQNLTLILDHINGDRNDHRLENLRLLCPNCNSQTETFGSRNIRRFKRLQKSSAIKSSGLCRITKLELEKLVWQEPSTRIAKRFGVSDKAIFKWCKKYGITKPGPGYWAKALVV